MTWTGKNAGCRVSVKDKHTPNEAMHVQRTNNLKDAKATLAYRSNELYRSYAQYSCYLVWVPLSDTQATVRKQTKSLASHNAIPFPAVVIPIPFVDAPLGLASTASELFICTPVRAQLVSDRQREARCPPITRLLVQARTTTVDPETLPNSRHQHM